MWRTSLGISEAVMGSTATRTMGAACRGVGSKETRIRKPTRVQRPGSTSPCCSSTWPRDTQIGVILCGTVSAACTNTIPADQPQLAWKVMGARGRTTGLLHSVALLSTVDSSPARASTQPAGTACTQGGKQVKETGIGKATSGTGA
jgi:hypothetical protein